MATAAPYPLLFEPILLEKVWGGRKLARYGKALPPGTHIGESWELADLDATSPTGAGGGAVKSVIARGPLRGGTLREALAAWGDDLLGGARTGPGGAFPLLIKLLDARENLSVQVHPSAEYAAGHPGAHLKTECWYVLEADPGGMIHAGLRSGVNREDLRAHAADGRIAGDLVGTPAEPGACHRLPSGTCHALGAGVVVAEVQTPSDTTFRLFDWGREGRALHLKEALACVDAGPAPAPTRVQPGESRGRLEENEFFSIDEVRGATGLQGCTVVMVVAGHGRLSQGSAAPVNLAPGTTVLVPHASVAMVRLEDAGGLRTLLVHPR